MIGPLCLCVDAVGSAARALRVEIRSTLRAARRARIFAKRSAAQRSLSRLAFGARSVVPLGEMPQSPQGIRCGRFGRPSSRLCQIGLPTVDPRPRCTDCLPANRG